MVSVKRTKREIVSYKMSRVRATCTTIENTLSKALSDKGLRGYRRNVRGVLGTPDFCWKGRKIAVFCDSSFWHGYNWGAQIENIKVRKKFWIQKIETNIERDKRINRELRKQGWKVLRFWDFELKKDLDKCVKQVGRNLAD